MVGDHTLIVANNNASCSTNNVRLSLVTFTSTESEIILCNYIVHKICKSEAYIYFHIINLHFQDICKEL